MDSVLVIDLGYYWDRFGESVEILDCFFRILIFSVLKQISRKFVKILKSLHPSWILSW